jgi:hypothetical protein
MTGNTNLDGQILKTALQELTEAFVPSQVNQLTQTWNM